MSKTFSITKEGINIPYRTFLADSASGLILILFLLLCYKVPIVTPIPLRASIPSSTNGLAFGPEITVFIVFALFLLATPLGFALNAISWLLLDQSIDALEQWCSRQAATTIYPVSSINAARHVELVVRQLGVHSKGIASEREFTSSAWFLRELLETPQLAAFAPDTAARGLMILFRNLTVVLLAASAVSLYSAHHSLIGRAAVFLVVILLCLVLILRWHALVGERRLFTQVSLASAAVIAALTADWLVISKWDNRFAAQAPWFALISLLLVLLQGVIGYYHRTLVLLNVYFAARSVDSSLAAVQLPEQSVIVEIASDILRKALKSSEQSKPGS